MPMECLEKNNLPRKPIQSAEKFMLFFRDFVFARLSGFCSNRSKIRETFEFVLFELVDGFGELDKEPQS